MADKTIRQKILFAALMGMVAVVLFLAYLPALDSRAIFFDDDEYLVQNNLVQNPGWSSLKRFITEVSEPSTVRGYYHPLAMISLMLDYAAGGRVDNLVVFHRTSLLLHIANTMLVIILFYLLFGRYWPAVLAGLLFGLHPLCADSVVWIAERKTVLAGFFAFGSFIFYVLYVRKKSRAFYLIFLLGYILAVLSKPTTIMLPFLLVLLDCWALQRMSKRAILEKIPLFIIFLLAGAAVFASQNRAAPVIVPFDKPLVQVPMLICHNIVFYLFKSIWPVEISAYYPFPRPFEASNPAVLLGLVGTVVLVIVLVVSVLKTRALLMGWLFFFVAVLPAMGILSFTDVITANRFMYLPILGFLMPLTAFLNHILYNKAFRFSHKSLWITAAFTAAVLGCVEFKLTNSYLQKWQSTEKLYRYMLTLSPNVAKLHNNLGNVLKYSDVEESANCYKKAIELDENFVMAYNNLGNTCARQGRIDDAIEYYEKALSIDYDPAVNYYAIYYNLGVSYADKGNFALAGRHFEKATELKPDLVVAYKQWAAVLASRGRLNEAVDKFRIILRIQPKNEKTYCNIGILLEQQGKITEAIEQYQQALKINPQNTKAKQLLQAALAKHPNNK